MLLADDASGALTQWLQQTGCHVAAAAGIGDAVEHAVRQGFSLLVIDSRRAHTMDLSARTGVRIIVLREAGDVELPATEAVDDVLLKPMSEEVFSRSVRFSLKQASLVNGFSTSLSQQRRQFVNLVQRMAASHDRSGQSERVARLAAAVAAELSLPYKRQEALELAVSLQTLGHAGQEIGDEETLQESREILRYLDAPADGPIESRILVLVDAFDALCGPRSYRPVCSTDVAFRELTRSGHDASLVRVLEGVVTGRITARPEPAPTPEKRRVGLLLFLGQAALRNGDFDAARQALEACLHLLHDTPVPGRVSACEGLAVAAWLEGDLQTAAGWMSRAWSAADGQSELMRARLQCTEGLIEASLGIAGDAFERARATFEALSSRADIGRTMLLQALVAETEAPLANALGYLSEHGLIHVPALEPALFGGLLVEALRRGSVDSLVPQFLTRFGQAVLQPMAPDLARRLFGRVPEQPVTEDRSLQIRTLGRVSISYGGHEIPDGAWKTRKSRSMFLYLACQDGRPVQDEKLMEMFWPEHDIDKARQNLYAAFTHVRKAFKGVLPEATNIVVCNKGAYRINPELSCQVDVLEFERLIKAANQNTGEKAAELRQQAEALYQGSFIDGCYDEWSLAMQDELEMQYQSVITNLIQCAASQQRHEVVLEYANRLLAIDSCAQEAHVLAMEAWLAQGRPDMAVRQYQNCHQSMVTELHAAPGPEVTRLYESIKVPA
ncbi:MAG: BTAD domain-containing putative transcriptional regulator [Candidatus Xenobia bacterium]